MRPVRIAVAALAMLVGARTSSSQGPLRIDVSIVERRLRVFDAAGDTLLVAKVAVGSGRTMSYVGRRWTFSTPRGVHTVISKDSAPVWVPPDWHFVELGRREHLRLVWIHGDTTIAFSDGSELVIRGTSAAFVTDGSTDPFRVGEHIVIDDVLYVPPIGHDTRKAPGELGLYRLSIGDGFAIHGTPDATSIGRAVTHGCLRVSDADLEWLYRRVPVGTRVYIY